jgi:hypothetical protein
METYAARFIYGPARDLPISGLFWGALIFVALVVSVILAARALEWLRNRKKPDGEAVVERGPTKDVLTEIVAEVWHSDQQRKPIKKRRKRVGKAQRHQSES